ncbi:MAG: PA0069 family radical SAM protein, partial [Pseudomonadota bacterium]
MPKDRLHGRGAVTNVSGRYEREAREAFDDGWESRAESEAEPLNTDLIEEKPRTIITRNDSPDIPFDRSINVYRGCEHGCIYCFARPTHAYLGHSPGLDFETKLYFKPTSATLLEREINKPSYRCQPLALGTNTDPYQPIERKLRITRAVLDVLHRHDHPVVITTKSALVMRDVDLLGAMAAKNLARVCLSITTLRSELARSMEPRAATPARRLTAIRALTEAGVPTAILTSPMIPGLNDSELEDLLQAGYEAGARYANYTLLRLPLEIKDLFAEWLEAREPNKAGKILSLIRQMRGGKLYKANFGERHRGEGPYADLIAQRFAAAHRKIGFTKGSWGLDCTQFRKSKGTDQL